MIEAYEAPAFSVEVSRRGAVSTVAIRGELDIFTEPEVLAVLAGLEPGYETLVVDLSECAFFASSGISMLLDLNTRGAREGFQLVVIKAPRRCSTSSTSQAWTRSSPSRTAPGRTLA